MNKMVTQLLIFTLGTLSIVNKTPSSCEKIIDNVPKININN